jgi:hypothetical protein
MANTITTTNRTIEITDVDADYVMTDSLPVWSVCLMGDANDAVFILEGAAGPRKCHLKIAADEPREHYFGGQNLKLAFTFADGTFSANAFLCINLGERGY